MNREKERGRRNYERFIYGYARVSAKDQNEARQLIALKTFGICQTRIFLDKQSGRDFQRPQYQRLLKRLKKGDFTKRL